jgi:hypothetical protein
MKKNRLIENIPPVNYCRPIALSRECIPNTPGTESAKVIPLFRYLTVLTRIALTTGG